MHKNNPCNSIYSPRKTAASGFRQLYLSPKIIAKLFTNQCKEMKLNCRLNLRTSFADFDGHYSLKSDQSGSADSTFRFSNDQKLYGKVDFLNLRCNL